MEKIRTDNKTRVLFAIFFALLAISVYLTYDRNMVRKDFYVINTEPSPEN